MTETVGIRVGQILKGPIFSEAMRVETIRSAGRGTWVAGLWWKEPLSPNEVAFDADVYLLKKARAQALKEALSQPVALPPPLPLPPAGKWR